MAKRLKKNWANRIVGHGEMPANEFSANPLNPRRHPNAQREALRGSLGELGWIQNVIVNRTTGNVIDGHARIEEALSIGDDTLVPFVEVELSEGEEKLALAILDPISAMATADREVLDMLLREVGTGDTALQQLLSDVAAKEGLYLDDASFADDSDSGTHSDSAEDNEEEDFRGVYALREDVVFPASNKWGIPDLRPEMCAAQIPTEVWGKQEITDPVTTLFVHGTAKFPAEASGGVLAFYVDDWRFESVWADAVSFAENAREFGWGALVTPDFSVWRDDPTAVQLWNIYRSRWVARYWQEAGIKIIPSLNWSDERSYEFAHLGIPRGLPVVSVQCRTTRSKLGKDYFIKGLSVAIEQLQPENVLIYGGSDHRQWLEDSLPEQPVYHWLESWTSMRRKRVFSKGAKHEESE